MEQSIRLLTEFPGSGQPFRKAQEGQNRLQGLDTAVAETEQRFLAHYGISVTGQTVRVVSQGAESQKTHCFVQQSTTCGDLAKSKKCRETSVLSFGLVTIFYDFSGRGNGKGAEKH